MNKFKFHDYSIDVTIEDQIFTLDCTTETCIEIGVASQKIIEIAKRILTGERTLDDVFAYCRIILDNVLGKGACDAIFEGRKKSVDDCMDLMLYLAQCIDEQQRLQAV